MRTQKGCVSSPQVLRSQKLEPLDYFPAGGNFSSLARDPAAVRAILRHDLLHGVEDCVGVDLVGYLFGLGKDRADGEEIPALVDGAQEGPVLGCCVCLKTRLPRRVLLEGAFIFVFVSSCNPAVVFVVNTPLQYTHRFLKTV